ncbi:unnamed protein product, partial [Mycena citricolor]
TGDVFSPTPDLTSPRNQSSEQFPSGGSRSNCCGVQQRICCGVELLRRLGGCTY